MKKKLSSKIHNKCDDLYEVIRPYLAGLFFRTIGLGMSREELHKLKDGLISNVETDLTDKDKETFEKLRIVIGYEIDSGRIKNAKELGLQLNKYSGITFIK
jgi:hypothetical protein